MKVTHRETATENSGLAEGRTSLSPGDYRTGRKVIESIAQRFGVQTMRTTARSLRIAVKVSLPAQAAPIFLFLGR